MAARIPCNTHGGLLSFAHSGMPGSLFHFHEVVQQLRGECGERQVPGAELGLVHSLGAGFRNQRHHHPGNGGHAVIIDPRTPTQAAARARRGFAGLWRGLQRGPAAAAALPDCGHVQFYQQAICRECGSERLEHRAASGRGMVHSFSVVHRAPGPAFKQDTPYAVLLVELEEGPRMISSLGRRQIPWRCTFDMAVELVCDSINDQVALPRFRPTRR